MTGFVSKPKQIGGLIIKPVVLGFLLTLVIICVGAVRIEYTDVGPEIPTQADEFPWIPQGLWGLGEGRFIVGTYHYLGQEQSDQLGMVGTTGIWVIGNGAPRLVLILHKGQPLISHAGGVAVVDDSIYIAGGRDGGVYRGPWVPDATTISVERIIDNPVPSSFLTVDGDGLLWIGQFYRRPSLNFLAEWRRGPHRWWATAIAYDQESLEPRRAIALRQQVQGMSFSTGKMILSLSYGQQNPSYLAVYPDPRERDPDEALDLPSGKRIPLHLPLGRLAEYRLPPMSEEIWFDPETGLLWVAYESAARERFPRVREGERKSRLKAYELPDLN